jgi:hypothetical protein
MKKFILFLLVIGIGTMTTHAQLKDALSKTAGAKANASSLLTQFSDAIKPASFLSSWASGGKTNWLSAASKVTDAVGMAKSVSSLAGFIKPEMFKSGFNLNSLLQTAGTVKTLAGASGLLKNLEGGLKPEAMVAGWAGKRSSWLSALNLLK